YGEQEKTLNRDAIRWRHYQNQASITKKERKRLARRLEAIDIFKNDKEWKREKYTLSSEVEELLENYNIPPELYNFFSGNYIQQVLHQELIEVLEDIELIRSRYASISEVKHFAAQALQCIQAGRLCNNLGAVRQGFMMSDLAHNLVSFASTYGPAVAQGVWQGLRRFVHTVFHPIQSGCELIQSAASVGKSLARVVGSLVKLGYLKGSDPEQFLAQYHEIKEAIACYSSSLKQKIEKNPEEAVKLIVSYATEFMLPCACFKAVKSLLKSAKVQQLSSNAVAYYKTLGNQEKTELLLQAPEGVIVGQALPKIPAIGVGPQSTASASAIQS
ncbi:MAG TPA: hypothetical protein VHA52_10985, partial [Candidatus Babeliaceae bacterium]|nr:hypothetical protein [Candidatus Babeliaceae bacterium]